MKCPNCASDVPSASNFCGLCGFDIRPARAAAQNLNQTVALETPSRPAAKVAAPRDNGATMHDSAPEPIRESAPTAEANTVAPVDVADEQLSKEQQPSKEYAPSPAIQSTAFDLQVTSMPAKGDQQTQPSSPNETFASMPALEPPAPGKFRETQWFMAAQDPDHIDNIGNVVLDDLEENYKPEDGNLDTQIRQKFSLNVPNVAGTDSGAAASSSATHGGPDRKPIFIAIGVVLAAVVAYFLLGGGP